MPALDTKLNDDLIKNFTANSGLSFSVQSTACKHEIISAIIQKKINPIELKLFQIVDILTYKDAKEVFEDFSLFQSFIEALATIPYSRFVDLSKTATLSHYIKMLEMFNILARNNDSLKSIITQVARSSIGFILSDRYYFTPSDLNQVINILDSFNIKINEELAQVIDRMCLSARATLFLFESPSSSSSLKNYISKEIINIIKKEGFVINIYDTSRLIDTIDEYRLTSGLNLLTLKEKEIIIEIAESQSHSASVDGRDDDDRVAYTAINPF